MSDEPERIDGFKFAAELPPGSRVTVYQGRLIIAGPETPVSVLIGDNLKAVVPLPQYDVAEPKRLDEALLGFRLV